MSDDLFKVNPKAKYATKEESKKLYKDIIQKINKVYQIFIDFYGEENVDLQGVRDEDVYFKNLDSQYRCYIENDNTVYYTNEISGHVNSMFYGENDCAEIYIHWKECVIENEIGDKHLIKDLFAKTLVTFEGKMYNYFSLTRTTFSLAEWQSDYAHSHLCGIPMKKNDEEIWDNPCLGIGPIRNTIATLLHGFDEEFWRLYCLELDLYVHIESLRGTPYRYLQHIGREGDNNDVYYFSTFKHNVYKNSDSPIQELRIQKCLNFFIIYMFKKNIPYIKAVNYSDKGGYSINFCPNTDVIKMSNEFLEFAKENNFSVTDYMSSGVYNSRHNGIAEYVSESESNLNLLNKKEMLCFKGNTVFLTIKKENNSIRPFKFLKFDLIKYILFAINNIYNCNLKFQDYGRKTSVIGEKPYRFL